jgi:1,2-diacylglycerol-3-alpha-glucose alpha-1,2-galactosyltransferase
MKVLLISQKSAYNQGFGINSAFSEHLRLLNSLSVQGYDIEVTTDPWARGVDVVHIHTVSIGAIMALFFRRNSKIVISSHITPETVKDLLPGKKFWMPIYYTYFKCYFGLANAVVAVSKANFKEMKQFKKKKLIHLIPNTVDLSRFECSDDERILLRQDLKIDDKFVVISSGNIQPRKRFDMFYDVAKALPDLQFVWMGDIKYKLGADSEKFAKMVDNLPPNLNLTGVLNADDVQKWTVASDIMFMPSDQETFGLSIVEGAGAGLPVVARDLKEYRQTFENNLIVGNTVEDFIQIIRELSQSSQKVLEGKKMSLNISNSYANNTDEVAKQYFALYGELLRG